MDEFITSILSTAGPGAPVVFIIVRALAIVVPPIPGLLIDTPGLLLFGWKAAFVYAEVGIMLGAMTAFFVARRFRRPVLRRFTSLERVQRWEARLSGQERFWGWVGLRLPTNPFFDYISYAAGLTDCPAGVFFFSTLLGNIPSMLLFFFVTGTAKEVGGVKGLFVAIGILLVIGVAWHRQRVTAPSPRPSGLVAPAEEEGESGQLD